MNRLLENTELITNYYGGDLELAKNSLKDFVDNIDYDIDALMNLNALETFDSSEFRKRIHNIKPSIFYMGLETLYAHTETVLQTIKTSTDQEQLFASFSEYFSILREEVEKLKEYAKEVLG